MNPMEAFVKWCLDWKYLIGTVVFLVLVKNIGGHVNATEQRPESIATASEGTRQKSAVTNIEWVAIPGGTFSMGASDSPDAQPHQVTVKSFEIAKTLVTNKQYQDCVAAGACTAAHVSDGECVIFEPGSVKPVSNLPKAFQGDEHPVVCVDWNQAKAFSKWVGGRLPSEAEWEYAARSGGKKQRYPWGNAKAGCARAVIDGCGNATKPVCSKPAGNTLQGLCDMAGNASEWVQDWYHDSYSGAPTDGSAWEDGGSSRVFRGGSWRMVSEFADSTARGHGGDAGDVPFGDMSFRPVR